MYLHGTGKGYVTVARKTDLEPPGDWQQRSYPVEKLYEVLPTYTGLSDVYISQNRFYGSRKIDNLAELSALYTDLDYYNRSELAGMRAQGVLDLSLEALIREQIPHPSLAMSTGRGLALVWRHEPVPGYVLGKWRRCQERIFEALRDLGADPMAKSATQVLRLAGTHNSKAGALVESIFEDLDYVWEFSDLADEILLLTSAELFKLRAQRAAIGPRTAPEREENPSERFSSLSLHHKRLGDLKRLIVLRGLDQLPPGQRNSWMLCAAVSLSHLVEAQALEKKVTELGRSYAGWSEGETRTRMHAVISRAHSAVAGEKVRWQGQQRDFRYRLTNQEIIARLEITSEEERHLETIISEETKRQRDRERKERERREASARPRDEYLAETRERGQKRQQAAKRLRGEGMSLRKIGKELGVSHTGVNRLLNADSPNEDLNDLI